MTDMRKWMNLVEAFKYGSKFSGRSIAGGRTGYTPISPQKKTTEPPSMSSRVHNKKFVPTSSDEIEVPTAEPKAGAMSKIELKKYLRQDNEYRKLDDFLSALNKNLRDRAPGASNKGQSKATSLRADRRAFLLKKSPVGPIR